MKLKVKELTVEFGDSSRQTVQQQEQQPTCKLFSKQITATDVLPTPRKNEIICDYDDHNNSNRHDGKQLRGAILITGAPTLPREGSHGNNNYNKQND